MATRRKLRCEFIATTRAAAVRPAHSGQSGGQGGQGGGDQRAAAKATAAKAREAKLAAREAEPELERAVLTQQFSLAEDAAAREREAAAAQLATAEDALACTAGEKHATDRREVEVAATAAPD